MTVTFHPVVYDLGVSTVGYNLNLLVVDVNYKNTPNLKGKVHILKTMTYSYHKYTTIESNLA